MDDVPTPERRAMPRIRPKGSVTLRWKDQPVRGRLVDLGPGGACVRIATELPRELVRKLVDIDLRLDGRQATWLTLCGRVLRIDAEGRIAVAFDAVPPAFERMISDETDASRHEEGIRRVVLVDASRDRRAIIAAAFRAADCEVVDVSTPLEAIVRLGESRYDPKLIAIADSVPEWIADELRAFVHVEHPRARIVAIGAELLHPAAQAERCASREPGPDLVARVRDLLEPVREPAPDRSAD